MQDLLGQVMHATGVTKIMGGEHEAIKNMMYANNIQPWDPNALLRQHLDIQQQIAKQSPFRYVDVMHGMDFFGRAVGGNFSFTQLTREKSVQLSLDMFAQKGLHAHPEEAKFFYDVFDSIDVYKNAYLNIGELAGGLPPFFGGNIDQRVTATFVTLAGSPTGYWGYNELYKYVKPFVWLMVPNSAQVIRPMIADVVAQEIFRNIARQSSSIGAQDMLAFMKMGYNQQMMLDNTTVYGNNILNRAANIIDEVVAVAATENKRQMDLRAYGQQTYQSRYGGQQKIQDVGAYRYGQQTVAPAVASGGTAAATQASQLFSSVYAGITDMWGNSTDPRARARTGSVVSMGTGQFVVNPTGSIGSVQNMPVGSVTLPAPPPKAPAPFVEPPKAPAYTQPPAAAQVATPAAPTPVPKPAAPPQYAQPAAATQYAQPAPAMQYAQPAAAPQYAQPAAATQYAAPAYATPRPVSIQGASVSVPAQASYPLGYGAPLTYR